MQKMIKTSAVLLGIVFLVGCGEDKAKPGNIYKKTYAECDEVGYGYKGMCYGRLAVASNDISICDKLNNEDFNKKKCIEEFNTGCVDSDDGKNIYIKGNTSYKDDERVTLHSMEDSCATKNENKQSENEAEYFQGIPSCMGTNCYILEGYCGEYQGSQIDTKEFIQCPNGCNDGACNSK